MRILWITSRLLPDACRAMGWGEDVVGGWMQSQLNALLRTYGNVHEYLILSSDRRRCDITIGKCVIGRLERGIAHTADASPQKSRQKPEA